MKENAGCPPLAPKAVLQSQWLFAAQRQCRRREQTDHYNQTVELCY
jgi:hypothetical protein